jgi:hypothetical protein
VPHRHLGQDPVDEVDGEVAHAPTEAARADAAALAGEGDRVRSAAPGADTAREAVLENSAPEILLDLAHHEGRQAARLLGALEEGWPV